MNEKFDIYKAGGIIIENHKLLVTKSFGKDFYVAPGGRIENKETPKQTLIRELKEELNIEIETKDIRKFGVFSSEAIGTNGQTIQMSVFFVSNYKGVIKIGNEVEEAKWIDSKDIGKIQLGSIFEHDVVPYLKKRKLID